MAAPDGLSMSLDDMIKKSTKAGARASGVSGGGSGYGHNGGMRRMGGAQHSGITKPGRSSFNQGRRQPQSQRGGRFGGRPGGRGHARSEKDFWMLRRKAQSCYIEEATGDVVVQYHATIIVRISPQGDILLDSGGFHKAMTLASFNDVLAAVGVKVSAPEAGRLEDSQWLVSDGRSLFRFQDGMTLATKGPHSATRGPLVMQAFNNPSAAAATFASNAAAAQVGVLPRNAPGVPIEGRNPVSTTRNRTAAYQGGSRMRNQPGGGGALGSGRGRARFNGGRGRASGGFNTRRGQPAGQTDQDWPEERTAMDVDMGGSDEGGYQGDQFQQHLGGNYRPAAFEERYGVGGMRSEGWEIDDDVPATNEQRRLYAQGRHT